MVGDSISAVKASEINLIELKQWECALNTDLTLKDLTLNKT
jgi:hypothetical protein